MLLKSKERLVVQHKDEILVTEIDRYSRILDQFGVD
jgi:hypothetical protein